MMMALLVMARVVGGVPGVRGHGAVQRVSGGGHAPRDRVPLQVVRLRCLRRLLVVELDLSAFANCCTPARAPAAGARVRPAGRARGDGEEGGRDEEQHARRDAREAAAVLGREPLSPGPRGVGVKEGRARRAARQGGCVRVKVFQRVTGVTVHAALEARLVRHAARGAHEPLLARRRLAREAHSAHARTLHRGGGSAAGASLALVRAGVHLHHGPLLPLKCGSSASLGAGEETESLAHSCGILVAHVPHRGVPLLPHGNLKVARAVGSEPHIPIDKAAALSLALHAPRVAGEVRVVVVGEVHDYPGLTHGRGGLVLGEEGEGPRVVPAEAAGLEPAHLSRHAVGRVEALLAGAEAHPVHDTALVWPAHGHTMVTREPPARPREGARTHGLRVLSLSLQEVESHGAAACGPEEGAPSTPGHAEDTHQGA
mmetsp:Transcript_13742/g.36820  ORF Transcript_13742/g.36820 Transcript_13742/m.36820 type:complete len:428 (+) Transcript_13742:485-1768(+)